MGKASFEWGDGVITVTSTTVGVSIKKQTLYRLSGLTDIDNVVESDLVALAMFYLSHVVEVEGDTGIHIPNGDATQDTVKQFIDDFRNAEEALVLKWDNAILQARSITNDPHLLPPDEVDPNA